MKRNIKLIICILASFCLGGFSTKNFLNYEIKFCDSAYQKAFFHVDTSYNNTEMCTLRMNQINFDKCFNILSLK